MSVKTVKYPGDSAPQPEYEGEKFETTLSNGRKVVMREMSARDLLFMERNLAKIGDIERGMRIAERISIEPGKITFPEIQSLGVKDFRKISDLAGKAGGLDEGLEDEGEEDSDFLE